MPSPQSSMPSRLKSLELQGYKTFASRTVFEFAPAVTAIVGPNGSGKSNIADSLRWVLGEQSFSLLRGKKTEDMIFAGSELRTRAGMASATVIFDNTDGWLPIDFSEVAITRRAYRDGSNEYLINGQRVRLKDVSELLAQSGLAERTYTIIGQGLVDAALALKAEERRRLFEEAAGIGLHRARREEALRRLDITHRNLDRVQDILAELQPRLRSLERQARRAQEYEQVKADLKLLLREWYGFHWHRSQKELALTREAVRLQEEMVSHARRETAGIDEKGASLRERIQELRARLNSWHRQSAQLHARREELGRLRVVSEERIRSLHQQANDLQARLTGLQEELQLHQEWQEAAASEVEQLKAELVEAHRQAETAQGALHARQAERAKAEADVQAARQALSGHTARHGQLQARLVERQAQGERLKKTLETAEGAVAAVQQEVQAAAARLHAQTQAQVEAQAAHAAAQADLQAHQEKLKEREAERKATLDQQAGQVAALAGLRAQLEVLEQAEQSLAGYSSGAQVLLQAARQARLAGTLGALSSHLVVPAEFETAIAAALGEYLDAVLLERDGDPEQALEVLADKAARAALLPLERLKPQAPLSLNGDLKDGSVIGIAADLVTASPELRPAIDLLLGQVIIVSDRPAARRVLAGRAGTVRAVTLRGEIFLASGPILAGLEGKGSTISRPRQRRDLLKRLENLETEVASLDACLLQMDSELRTTQQEADRLEKAERAARAAVEAASNALNLARLTLQQSERQAAWQVEQRQRLQAEIDQGQHQAIQITEELADLEAEIASARETLRERVNGLAELAPDELQSQVAHWNTLVSVADKALGEARARLRDRQELLERVRGSLTDIQNRQAETASELMRLEGEKASQRQAEGEVNTEIEALRSLLEPAEAELDTTEGEQEQLQSLESAARQSLSQAEHHHAQARIALARETEALDSLRRRIEDDFGLVSFEYSDEVSGQATLPLEGMVEELPRVAQLAPELDENIKRQRAILRRIGAINPEAQAEYQEVRLRYDFLTEQVTDLEKAREDIRQVIAELDALMQREFRKTFDAVAEEFKAIFTRLFGGGSARLVLTDPEDLTNTGIDIEARLPGRRMQGLTLLSGGERSLTANSLVFALLRVSPTPFCVLDEVDAMLDEANVGRFRELMRELSRNTQFIIVTHNRNTVQAADVIYGVTMGRDSASQVISLKLDEVSDVYSNSN